MEVPPEILSTHSHTELPGDLVEGMWRPLLGFGEIEQLDEASANLEDIGGQGDDMKGLGQFAGAIGGEHLCNAS